MDGDGSSGNGSKNLLSPRFTGRVDLGHIIQLLGMAILVASAVFGSYLFVNGRLSEQGETIRSLQSQITDLRTRQKEADDDRRQLARDLAISIEAIKTTLNDVRILIAGIRDGVRK